MHKPQIESAYGGPLEWDQKEGRETSYIRKKVTVGGLQNEDNWSKIQDAMANEMAILEIAIKSFIK